MRTLDRVVHQGKGNWILEADIVSFFDSLDRTKLKKMLEVRVADGSLLRLIEMLARGRAGGRGAVHVGNRHRSGVGAISTMHSIVGSSRE